MMAIDERSRRTLYLRLVEVLGEDEASTLMSHLPAGGTDEVATKRDLQDLGADLRSEMR